MGFAFCKRRDYLQMSIPDDCIDSPNARMLSGVDNDLRLINTHPVGFKRFS